MIKSGVTCAMVDRKKFSELSEDDDVKSLVPNATQKRLFVEIQKRSVDANYLTADDYDAVVRVLGLHAGKVEFDLPMPHLSRDPLLWQQFENLHVGIQSLGDRLTAGINDGIEKQTAAADRLAKNFNDSMATLTSTLVQLLSPHFGQTQLVTGLGNGSIGSSTFPGTNNETEIVENKESKATDTSTSSVHTPPTDTSASTVQAPSTATSTSSIQTLQSQSTVAPIVNNQTGTTAHASLPSQAQASVQPLAFNTSVTTTTVTTLTPQVSSVVVPNIHSHVQVPTVSQSVHNTGHSSVYAPAAVQSLSYSTPMAQGSQPLQGSMPIFNPSVPPPLLGYQGGRYGPGPERLRDYDFQQEPDPDPGLDFADGRQRSFRGRARTRERLKPSISNVKVPEFDGVKPWRNFITRFERLCDAFGLEGDVRLEWLLLSLTDRASAFVATLPRHVQTDYDLLLHGLTERFDDKIPEQAAYSLLLQLKQLEGESSEEFAERIRELARQATSPDGSEPCSFAPG